MLTRYLTDDCEIFTPFETTLLENCRDGEETRLCVAPTTRGEIACYVSAEGREIPVGIWSEFQGWLFGYRAFGRFADREILVSLQAEGFVPDRLDPDPPLEESPRVTELRVSLAAALADAMDL